MRRDLVRFISIAFVLVLLALWLAPAACALSSFRWHRW
jgi:hypothetical protein